MKHLKLWMSYVERSAAVLFIPLLRAYLYNQHSEVNKVSRMLVVKNNLGMTTVVDLPDGS